MLFITRTGKMSGAPAETPTSPIQICDCGAPGLSTRVTTRVAAFANRERTAVGRLPFFQAANRFSSSGKRAAALVSPTTNRAALEGWNHALCQATRSWREMAFTERAVPSPG